MQKLFRDPNLSRHMPKAVQVYEILRSNIISMRLFPGSVIVEKDLCEQLEVSRTPLREAILKLAAERLVDVKPGGGTYVSKILLPDVLQGQMVRDTFEMRLALIATRKYTAEYDGMFEIALFEQKNAARIRDADEFFRLDNEFHQKICQVAGFPEAWRVIHDATGHLDRVRRLAFPIENNFDEVLQEHTVMHDCMRRNDVDGLEKMFRVQLDSTFPTIELINKMHPDILDGAAQLTDIR